MTGEEYTREKTALVEEHTGMPLIPKEQIIDFEINTDMVLEMADWIDDVTRIDSKGNRVPITMYSRYNRRELLTGSNCLYCSVFVGVDCTNCPMSKAGNHCNNNQESTYKRALKAVKEDNVTDINALHLGLIDLADRFVAAHEHLVEEQECQ